MENASATAFAAGTGASASASDGLTGDKYLQNPAQQDQDGGTMATPPGLPGGGRLQQPKLNSGTATATFDRTLSASGSSTYSAVDSFPGIQNAKVSYTVTVHATPYNFRHTNFPDGPGGVQVAPGDLYWHYSWSSTTGNVADLAGQDIHENLTFSGSTANPPFGWQPPPFHDRAIPAQNGDMTDDNTWGAHLGDTPAQSFVKLYKASSFSTTQSFKYYDPATMALDEETIPLSIGPFTITSSVYADSSQPSGYSYTVAKDNITSPPLALPK